MEDLSRLLNLDYRPLEDRIPHGAVDQYRAAHRVGEDPDYGDLDVWPGRYRFDTFAQLNGLSYAPEVDPVPYDGTGFDDGFDGERQHILDAVSTPEGGVTLASAAHWRSVQHHGIRSSLRKFIAIRLDHHSPLWTLAPRSQEKQDAVSELDQHFEFTGDEVDIAAYGAIVGGPHAEPQPGGWYQRWRASRRKDKQIEALRTEGSAREEARMFDDSLGQLIVQHAQGLTIEGLNSRVFIYREVSGAGDLAKPEIVRQLFTAAAILGPGLAQVTRSE